MKFHNDRCKGKAVMRWKPKCGLTDGRHGDSCIPPLTSLRGVYLDYVESKYTPELPGLLSFFLHVVTAVYQGMVMQTRAESK